MTTLEQETKEGLEIIAACYAVAKKADPNDAPMPLHGAEAALWHRARMEAFGHCLEMLNAETSFNIKY